MDLFASVLEIEIADEDNDTLLTGEEALRSLRVHPHLLVRAEEEEKFMPFVFFFPPSTLVFGRAGWFGRLERISAVHSPVSPWSGAKLLPNKTGCIPRAPPSSLQSALVFAPFI